MLSMLNHQCQNLNNKGKVDVAYKKFVDNPGVGNGRTMTDITAKDFAKFKNEAGFDPNKRLERDKNGLMLANEANKKILDSAK
jgi:hypothetical protein